MGSNLQMRSVLNSFVNVLEVALNFTALSASDQAVDHPSSQEVLSVSHKASCEGGTRKGFPCPNDDVRCGVCDV